MNQAYFCILGNCCSCDMCDFQKQTTDADADWGGHNSSLIRNEMKEEEQLFSSSPFFSQS